MTITVVGAIDVSLVDQSTVRWPPRPANLNRGLVLDLTGVIQLGSAAVKVVFDNLQDQPEIVVSGDTVTTQILTVTGLDDLRSRDGGVRSCRSSMLIWPGPSERTAIPAILHNRHGGTRGRHPIWQRVSAVDGQPSQQCHRFHLVTCTVHPGAGDAAFARRVRGSIPPRLH